MNDHCDAESHAISSRALIELINSGTVDCDCLVRVAQLMMVPDFEAFFAALCEVDLTTAHAAGTALALCAEGLACGDMSTIAAIAEVVGTHRPATSGSRAT